MGIDHIPLQDFKTELASTLCMSTEGMEAKKRGRPSLELDDHKRHRGGGIVVMPPKAIRLDGHQHWPEHARDTGRCRFPKCKGKTHVICRKCCTGATQSLMFV